MAEIGTTLAIYDQMTQPLQSIRTALDKTISSFDAMQNSANNTFDSSSYDDVARDLEELSGSIEHAEQTQWGLNSAMEKMSMTDVHQDYDNLNRKIDETEDKLKQNNQQQEEFTEEVNNSNKAYRGLHSIIGKVSGILAGGKFLKGGLDRLMGVDTAQAKLMALGHTAQGVEQITNNALDSVTGTSFRMEEAVTTAASAVAAGIKPGQDLERYLSLTADTAAIAGSSMQEMGSIFNKVMTDGRIQAEELNQLGDRGIPIIAMLADELGVAQNEIRELAREGEISSQTFLNAIENGFGGAAQIMGEASLEAIIDNIGASISRMSANFLNGADNGRGFFDTVKPLLVDLLDWMRSIESNFAVVGAVIGELFNRLIGLVQTVGGLIQKYWSIIQPIFWGAVTALGAYVAIQTISKGIELASAGAKAIHAGATWLLKHATDAAAFSQLALNTQLMLVIGIAIAVIAIFYGIVAAINHFTGASISATGIIAGAFAWLGTAILNILIFVANVVLTVVNFIVIAFQFGIWAIQVAVWGLGLAFTIVLDVILNIAILVVNTLVNVFNFGLYAIQLAFVVLATVVLVILDVIVNTGIVAVELLVNGWNWGLYILQVAWIGLNMLVRTILQAIVNFGISAAENFANAWNKGIYGLQQAFYQFQIFVSKVLQAVGQGAIGVVNSVLGGITTLINGAVGGLNSLISMANKIPGVNIGTVGTVDLKVGSGVQSIVDNIGSGLVAPVQPEVVSLGRSTIADSYDPQIPSTPQTFSLEKSSLTADFLGKTDFTQAPKWENTFDYQRNAQAYADTVEFPEFPELQQTFDMLEFKSLSDAWDKGYEWGENLENKVKDFSLEDAIMDWLDIEIPVGDDPMGAYGDEFAELDELLNGSGGGSDLGDAADKATGGKGKGGSSAGDKAAKNLKDIADNTDDIAKNTGLSKDDLKYMRDLASREFVNRYTTNQINFDVGGISNQIDSELDLDGVVDYLARELETAVDATVEGVYG